MTEERGLQKHQHLPSSPHSRKMLCSVPTRTRMAAVPWAALLCPGGPRVSLLAGEGASSWLRVCWGLDGLSGQLLLAVSVCLQRRPRGLCLPGPLPFAGICSAAFLCFLLHKQLGRGGAPPASTLLGPTSNRTQRSETQHEPPGHRLKLGSGASGWKPGLCCGYQASDHTELQGHGALWPLTSVSSVTVHSTLVPEGLPFTSSTESAGQE